ncbi:hypothetical protein JCM9533A_78430 [Catenuloplanes niger JCM 9533]
MFPPDERYTDDAVAELAAALRLPDLPRSDGPCTADAVVVPWFTPHDATGAWVRPGRQPTAAADRGWRYVRRWAHCRCDGSK